MSIAETPRKLLFLSIIGLVRVRTLSFIEKSAYGGIFRKKSIFEGGFSLMT
jgi:hypothetical protein